MEDEDGLELRQLPSIDRGFAIQEVAGKGKGLVALRPFFQGDIVLADTPLFSLRKEDLVSWETEPILAALSNCTLEQREEFYQLYNRHADSGDIPRERGILDTNVLPYGTNEVKRGNEPQERHGLFLLASRLNSSCVPNVHQTWDDETGQLVFRATRNLLPGEELCIAYGDTLADREERRKELQEKFGFVCVCEACTLSGQALEESNFRRACLGGMLRDYDVQGVDGDPMQGLGEVRPRDMSTCLSYNTIDP